MVVIDQDQYQDRELARAYRQAHEPGDRDGCPQPETLAALAAGEPHAASDKLLDHVAGCSACAAEVGLAMEADNSLRGLAGRVAGDDKPVRRPRWLVWSPAIAVLVAVLVVPLVFRLDTAPPDTAVRGEQTDVSPPSGASLQELPHRYQWPRLPGDHRYRLVLMDAAAEPLWTSEWTRESSIKLDDATLGRLDQPGVYIWQVRVEGATTELGPYHFAIKD